MNLAIILQAQPVVIDSVSKAKIASNSQKFLQIDPWGIGLTVIGMFVVFMSLLILYLMFMNITKLLNYRLKQKQIIKAEKDKTVISKEEPVFTGELNAAICLAVAMYLDEIHDTENTVLTINRVARTYSPWSSKIYGLRQYPR
ncbi:MAG: hypothetical protein Fur0015_04800 [Ignavibacteriales bacterium]